MPVLGLDRVARRRAGGAASDRSPGRCSEPLRSGAGRRHELLGHARLETTRGYTRPTAEDHTRALDLLLVDQ